MTDELKVKNIYISLNLLKITYYSRRNFYINKIESYFYTLNANAIYYKKICLTFKVLENIIYLGITLYKSL